MPEMYGVIDKGRIKYGPMAPYSIRMCYNYCSETAYTNQIYNRSRLSNM